MTPCATSTPIPSGDIWDCPIRVVRIAQRQTTSKDGTGAVYVPCLEHFAFQTIDAMVQWMIRTGFDPKQHYERVHLYHESQGLIPELGMEKLIERFNFHKTNNRSVGDVGGP